VVRWGGVNCATKRVRRARVWVLVLRRVLVAPRLAIRVVMLGAVLSGAAVGVISSELLLGEKRSTSVSVVVGASAVSAIVTSAVSVVVVPFVMGTGSVSTCGAASGVGSAMMRDA
jgi:Mg/Co/Ni transporter MgtE